MMNGILPLYKPKGMTSHDCVMKVRKLFKMKKVGHTGTLDPEVEGVLPICLGEATKIIPFLRNSKTYVAEVFLGIATTTEDSYGEIIEQKDVTSPPSDEEIQHVLENFKGTIKQIPPMYSAVKVDGMRLYEYARKNIPVKRPERFVTIYQIERLVSSENHSNNQQFRIKIKCSKGTYIRTLCVDIGAQLGFPSHMSYLIRTESDSFTIEETVTFSEIQQQLEQGHAAALLLPIERALEHLPTYHVTEDIKQRVLNGQKLPSKDIDFDVNTPFKVTFNNQLLAIYERHPQNTHEVKPIRVLHIHKD